MKARYLTRAAAVALAVAGFLAPATAGAEAATSAPRAPAIADCTANIYYSLKQDLDITNAAHTTGGHFWYTGAGYSCTVREENTCITPAMPRRLGT